jgi:cytidylate kinase
MSIVAISQTLGSLGDEVGRSVAQRLGYEYADREIILRAAERFGEGVMTLEHITEEKPTLWERVTDSHRHYQTLVEAIILEMAARDNVVLSGRGTTFVLRPVRHALRVRITEPERARARRVQAQHGVTAEAAEHMVRQSDRERGARLRFIYHADWDDPLHYDLVVNAERLTVSEASQLILDSLRGERVQPTAESLGQVRDLSLAARAQAALYSRPETRPLHLRVACQDAWVTVSGAVDRETDRKVVEETLAQTPGVAGVKDEMTVMTLRPPSL